MTNDKITDAVSYIDSCVWAHSSGGVYDWPNADVLDLLGELRTKLTGPEQPTTQACGKPVHKACRCVRPLGHPGACNCLYPSGLPAGTPHDGEPTATDVAAKQMRKLQWGLLEAALFSLSNAQFEYERNLNSEAGLVHVNDVRRALGALALSMSDGPDAAGYVKLFEAILAEPKVRRS